MKTLGLTGPIASGKSTIAACFAARGVPVFDADRWVHAALSPGGAAAEEVARRFPSAMRGGVIDRAALGALVFTHDAALADLEALLHPKVRAAEEAFIAQHRVAGSPLILLEIPLLFETGADALCDATILAVAPEEIRIARALSRPHMTPEKLARIMARQTRAVSHYPRATHRIDTSGSEAETAAQVEAVLYNKTLSPDPQNL